MRALILLLPAVIFKLAIIRSICRVAQKSERFMPETVTADVWHFGQPNDTPAVSKDHWVID